MPARAFLLFGREAIREVTIRVTEFQCPRGHFCFSDTPAGGRDAARCKSGFNAREGIFAFRTKAKRQRGGRIGRRFNAREGILLFGRACSAACIF